MLGDVEGVYCCVWNASWNILLSGGFVYSGGRANEENGNKGMPSGMRILVTGGAGYIGSVVVEKLLATGHNAVVYDNLSQGHREAVLSGAEFLEAEILDSQALHSALTKHKIDAVIHMAASALVGESCVNPAKYYANNLVTGLALLEAMRATGVSGLILSSTAAVYGESEKPLIDETA